MKRVAERQPFFNTILPMYSVPELIEKVNSCIEKMQFNSPAPGLYAPITYSLAMGGKRIRPLLMLLAYNLYKENVSDVLEPAVGIEVYHNYTLLHDDLMDHADKRRGKTTVYKVWGDNAAILSGDAMLVLAYQLMTKVSAEYIGKVLDVFSQTALEICEGQQLDMEFENRKDVSVEEYIEMIRLKTSVLLAASLKIGATLGDASQSDIDNLYAFGVNLGLAFQLRDDLLDVYGDPAVFGKNIGGDILSNKKTYLLINALKCADRQQLDELNRWLDADSFDPQEKVRAVTDLYDQIGIKEMCEKKIEEYSLKALECLKQVNVTAVKKDTLVHLMEKLMCRVI